MKFEFWFGVLCGSLLVLIAWVDTERKYTKETVNTYCQLNNSTLSKYKKCIESTNFSDLTFTKIGADK